VINRKVAWWERKKKMGRKRRRRKLELEDRSVCREAWLNKRLYGINLNELRISVRLKIQRIYLMTNRQHSSTQEKYMNHFKWAWRKSGNYTDQEEEQYSYKIKFSTHNSKKVNWAAKKKKFHKKMKSWM